MVLQVHETNVANKRKFQSFLQQFLKDQRYAILQSEDSPTNVGDIQALKGASLSDSQSTLLCRYDKRCLHSTLPSTVLLDIVQCSAEYDCFICERFIKVYFWWLIPLFVENIVQYISMKSWSQRFVRPCNCLWKVYEGEMRKPPACPSPFIVSACSSLLNKLPLKVSDCISYVAFSHAYTKSAKTS